MPFPTVRYHRDGRNVTVTTPAELAALSADWRVWPTAHLSEEEYQDRYGSPAPQSAGMDRGGAEVSALPEQLGGGLPGAVAEPGVPALPEGDRNPAPSQTAPKVARLCKNCGQPGHNVRNCKVRL